MVLIDVVFFGDNGGGYGFLWLLVDNDDGEADPPF
jgi:hypothetical protein